MTIAEAYRRVETAINGLEDAIINEIIPAAEADMVEMQTERLFSGLNADGTPIKNLQTGSSEYSNLTVDFKLRRGQPTDRITLKDTGEFYKVIYATSYDGKEVIFDSTDDKSGELKLRYGEEIFGLTNEDKPNVMEITTSGLRDYVKDVTGFE